MADEINRIERSLEETRAQMTAQPVSELSKLYEELDMDILEFCNCQELKSLAQAQGWITYEEAMTIYQILGETVEHYNHQPLPEKIVVTRIHHQLLLRKVGKGSHLK